MRFLGAHWRILLVLALLTLAGTIVGISRHQVVKCRAEVAEFRRAYDLMSQSVQRQNAAILEAEGKAAEAAQRGATARSQAQPVVEAAQKSADALAGAMTMPPRACSIACGRLRSGTGRSGWRG